MKYLAIIIDDDSRFKDHCDFVLKKIDKKIGFLNRTGNYITAYNRCVACKAIIVPQFEYCATLIIDVSETQLGMLQRTQNRTMRIILHCDEYIRIEHVLQVLQFMSVKQRLHYAVCIFIHKILNNVLPLSLRNKIETMGSENQRHTRQTGNIVLGFRKTRNARKSVFYEGAKLYNSLPLGIRDGDRLKEFKRELKDYILNTIRYA